MKWYEKSFGEDYLLIYKHRNQQEANYFVKMIMGWLKLPLGSQILDLCCGAGRYALALADAGYHVTGVDLSPVLLRKAKEADLDRHVRWVEGDMRALPEDGTFTECFDAVVNLFTSFGYFETDDEQFNVLMQIRRGLKPGGRFVIDVINAKYIQDTFVPFSQRKENDMLISERRWVQNSFVNKEIVIEKAGSHPRTYTERVKLYSLEVLGAMLQDAGLVLDKVYGGYGGESYDERCSPRMILLGERTQ
ncbi:class I SAM-dependent methyltransferase [Paenibacillus brevis]|uniref:Class I SAM-dependent methyltransferase n=1 Tax=Paenibacillus brevis TaxID=2841508 RepID=A0ABS6FVG8_9BACL|nr:class I SAM-dependent methyltransferase [Paenibacillus brevis]MBU5673140.1 class I SAM-dependent methyltransferase [Paenibacillus brevis]